MTRVLVEGRFKNLHVSLATQRQIQKSSCKLSYSKADLIYQKLKIIVVCVETNIRMKNQNRCRKINYKETNIRMKYLNKGYDSGVTVNRFNMANTASKVTFEIICFGVLFPKRSSINWNFIF